MPLKPCPSPPPRERPAFVRLLVRPFGRLALALGALLLAAGPTRAFQIVEFNLGCANGERAAMWVQLEGRDFELMEAALGLQTYDRSGTLLFERRRVFGSRSGSAWFPGERWFIGTNACDEVYTDFENATPFPSDAALLVPLDSLAGRIVLFRLEGTVRVPLQEVRYGPGGDIDAPPPGSSAVLAGSSWRWNPTPIVRRYDGYSFAGSSCLRYPRLAVRELMLACEDGDSRGGFLELEASGVRPSYDARIRLRAYDRDGALIAELADVFGTRAGESCTPGSRWLLASDAFATAAGAIPDRVLPFALDPVAGHIELSGTFHGTFWMLDSLSYGRAGVVRPPDGLAIEHAPLSRLVTVVAPSPTTSRGDTLSVPECAFGSRAPAAFVQEVALRCADGGLDGQFVELSARDGDVTLRGAWSLRAYAHDDALVFTLPLTGAGAVVLTPRTGWLATSAAPGTWDVLAPDAVLPAALDTLGGRVELIVAGALGDSVVSTLAWGANAHATPPAGSSLEANGRSSVVAKAYPTPTDLLGRAHATADCLASDAPHGFVVSEVGTHCQDGSSAGLFVELASDSTRDAFDPTIGLRLRSPAGVTLATCFPMFANAARRAWPNAGHWLVAAAGFTARNGLAPDAVLDAAPDAGSAVISVFRRDPVTGRDTTLHAMAVSTAPPPPGRSIVRLAAGDYGVSGVVTPTRADGAVVAPGACYVRARPEAVRLGELFLRCRDGETSARYVELVASDGDASYAPDLIVRVFDHDNRLLGALSHVFGALEGQPWRAGRPFMLGSEGVAARLGIAPDAALPLPLDTLGGRIQLLLAGGEGGLTLDELRWGTIETPTPGPGASLERDGERWRVAALPTPANRDHDGARLLPCLGDCPPRTVRMAFGSDQLITSARANLSAFEARAELDATRGAWSISAGFDETRALLPDRFTLLGIGGAAAVSVRARLEWLGAATSACDTLGACAASRVFVALRTAGHADSASAAHDTSAVLDLTFDVVPGQPFELVSEGRATGELSRGFRASLTARLMFELPTGGRVASCYGYDSRLARGAGDAVVFAGVGLVRIEWPVLDASTFRGTVERRETGGDWLAIEDRTADADGVVRFGDRRAIPGHTYRYRLVWEDVFGHQSTPAVTVAVPVRAVFGLLGARPNPVHGALNVAFELAEAGEARLEVMDVAGRVVARVSRSLGPGTHTVALATRLAPGLYVIRLHTAGHEARTTVVAY